MAAVKPDYIVLGPSDLHEPKAARSKQHGVVHYYQRPDDVKFSEHTFWPDEATARAVVAGGLK